MEPTVVLSEVCANLAAGETLLAGELIRKEFPFVPPQAVERKYGAKEALRIFVRDGFIDRYSGARLVFPGVLRLIAHLLPAEFPFQSNWKMTETHLAFWQLTPTIDHVVPVSRDGRDGESNWITTSMLRNSAKASWTLEELGWSIHPAGNLSEWDGQLSWFRSYVAAHPEIKKELPAILTWCRAAVGPTKAAAELDLDLDSRR